MRTAVLLLTVGMLVAAEAQELPSFEGPPPPADGAVVNRDESGRATIRAVRLESPLRVDGVLDEPFYERTPSISDFIQLEPDPGAAATEKTELWLAFDANRIYVSVRCWDSDMRIIATEMRRDNFNIFQGNDMVVLFFDTFHDRRNSLAFTVNPLGGRMDGQVANERQYNADWNPVWDVRTARFDQGWTFEAAIPFKSLRYGTGPLWGFNAMRAKRSRNELSTLTKVPPARGAQAAQQMSLAATVIGLEPPPDSRPLDLKPYVTSSLTSDMTARPTPIRNNPDASVGFDAKYALTDGISADFTVNTDFAQVEADEQQVNLTRFSLFFPEKREFFLENQGTFSFGGIAVNAGNNDAPVLFYSRHIGLNQGQIVPLRLGGRVTGRAGAYSIGVLNIQTGEVEQTGTGIATRSTNFAVARLRRDVLARSGIGVLAAGRTVTQDGSGSNATFGVDATFAFFANLNINTYWAKTQTSGLRGDDHSYRGQLDYTGDRYIVQLEHMLVGDHFNPEIGFVRRDNMERSAALFKFTPRLRNSRRIRKLNYGGSVTYTENRAGHLESREQLAEFAVDFINGDRFAVSGIRTFEYLPRPFNIASGIVLPVGPYGFEFLRVNYNMAQQRPRAANITLETGTFYNGRKTTLNIARGRAQVLSQLSIEPTYSVNRVSLTEGRFTTHLAGSRVTYTMTPLMFVSALVQYSSSADTLSVNARLRWEYQPGSELFVVYNEQRDTGMPGSSMLDRAVIVKVNRLFRF